MILTVRSVLVPHLVVSVRLLVVPVSAVDVVRPVVVHLDPLLATLRAGVSLGAVRMFTVDPGVVSCDISAYCLHYVYLEVGGVGGVGGAAGAAGAGGAGGEDCGGW